MIPKWEQRLTRTRLGRCTRCSAPLTDAEKAHSKQCEKCLANQRAFKKAQREADRAAGICTQCRKNPAAAGRAACASCLDKHNRWRRSYSRRPPRSERGLCQSCGKSQFSPYADCVTCRTNRRISTVWKEAREAREAKKAVDGQGANVA